MKTLKSSPTYRGERGQSLVELAISFVVIVFLLAGAIDFGMALFTFVVLKDAAKEGATYGSMNPTDVTGITARVRAASPREEDQFAFYPIAVENHELVDVVVDWTDPTMKCEGISAGIATGITVSVEFDYRFNMPLLGAILGTDTVSLRATATDTILTPTCP